MTEIKEELHDEPTKRKLSPRELKLMALLGFIVPLAVALHGYNSFLDWGERGQYGDLFGSANAFYSALAFLLLVYTNLLQREQLDTQREELRLALAEAKLAREVQEKSAAELTKQTEAAQEQLELAKIADHNARQPVLDVLPRVTSKGMLVEFVNYGHCVSQVWIDADDVHSVPGSPVVLPTNKQTWIQFGPLNVGKNFYEMDFNYRDTNGVLMVIDVRFQAQWVGPIDPNGTPSAETQLAIDNLTVKMPKRRD